MRIIFSSKNLTYFSVSTRSKATFNHHGYKNTDEENSFIKLKNTEVYTKIIHIEIKYLPFALACRDELNESKRRVNDI